MDAPIRHSGNRPGCEKPRKSQCRISRIGDGWRSGNPTRGLAIYAGVAEKRALLGLPNTHRASTTFGSEDNRADRNSYLLFSHEQRSTSDGSMSGRIPVDRTHGGNNPELLDFSASINPLGPPGAALKELSNAEELLTRYPDPSCARYAPKSRNTLASRRTTSSPETARPSSFTWWHEHSNQLALRL